jgi:hypothetical protein
LHASFLILFFRYCFSDAALYTVFFIRFWIRFFGYGLLDTATWIGFFKVFWIRFFDTEFCTVLTLDTVVRILYLDIVFNTVFLDAVSWIQFFG